MALTRHRVLHLHLNYVQMEYCTRFDSKYAIDGLRLAELIPDDRPEFVLGVHEQQRRGDAQVSIILLPQSQETSLPAALHHAREEQLFTVSVDSPVDNLAPSPRFSAL